MLVKYNTVRNLKDLLQHQHLAQDMEINQIELQQPIRALFKTVDKFLQEMKHHFTSSDCTKKTYRNKKGV
jgi:hypothetical protein